MPTYGFARRAMAHASTKQFWNLQQTWKHFAAPLTGLTVGVARVMWHGWNISLVGPAIIEGLLWAVCFYAVAWVGTFIMNYIWTAPAALHREERERANRAQESHKKETDTLKRSLEAETGRLREAKAELNAAADMRGTIHVTPQSGSAAVHVYSDCANHGRKACQISKLAFSISNEAFPGDFPATTLLVPLLPTQVQTVAHGEKFHLDDGFALGNITVYQLKQSTIRVHLIDSLGVEYLNTLTEISH